MLSNLQFKNPTNIETEQFPTVDDWYLVQWILHIFTLPRGLLPMNEVTR
jgi:hypothetical protein